MKTITESAEHHFLTTLESLKVSPKGWTVFSFSLSRSFTHDALIKKPAAIMEKIGKARAESAAFAESLARGLEGIEKGYIYLFSDGDVIALTRPQNEKESEQAQKTYWEKAKMLPAGFSEANPLEGELYNLQKLADNNFLMARRVEAYAAMGDANKVSSIHVRRERRENPKVMIIEDDRFTAAYTAGILSKEYDLIVCRNGEEGIISYVEHAPDIVFLDIHLPGLNGHETLQAIRAVDPQAFIVMLSVDTAKDSIVQATSGGASKFLKKPFTKQRLLETVKHSPFVRGAYVPPPEGDGARSH